mgnify:CR=1 FL=1
MRSLELGSVIDILEMTSTLNFGRVKVAGSQILKGTSEIGFLCTTDILSNWASE